MFFDFIPSLCRNKVKSAKQKLIKSSMKYFTFKENVFKNFENKKDKILNKKYTKKKSS